MRAPHNGLLVAAGIFGLPGTHAAPAPGLGSLLQPVTDLLKPVTGSSTSSQSGLGSFLNPITGALETLTDGLVQTSIGSLEGVLGESDEYDYVVIGGGTGGNTVAYRLAAKGYTVALIEAGGSYEIGKPVLGTAPLGDIIGVGGNPLDSIPTVDWGLVTEPQPGAAGRSLHYAQGRCLGGSTGLNFMVYHRPTRGSLDMWADAVGDDSYRFDDFLPYMQKSMNFDPNDTRPAGVYKTSDFTAGGPLQITYSKWLSDWAPWVIKGFEALGIPITTAFNEGKLYGWHYTQATIKAREQVRSTSAEFIYRANREKLQNLKVYLGTRAQKILFDAKRATGVQVQGALPFTIKAKREVILSAGAFFSPQLLMLSGIGPKDELTKMGIDVVADRPGVGQNLTDQPLFGVSYEVSGVDTLSKVLGNPLVLAKAVVDYITKQEGPLTSNVAEILAWGRQPSQSKMSQQTVAAIDAIYPQDWPYFEYVPVAGYIGKFSIPYLDQPKDGRQYSAMMGILVAPLSRGSVTLKSTDVFTPPRIDPGWLTDPTDIAAAIALYRQLRAFYTTEVIRSKRPNNSEKYPGLESQTDDEIIARIRESMMTIYHASCTNRMGRRDDPTAVVDASARVIGVDGLRVVDASAFAILPPGHPQSVVYALAEKIADAIIQDAKA